MQAKKFIVGPYRADWETGKLEFDYRIEFSDAEPLTFTEKVELPAPPFVHIGSVQRVLEGLSLVLGISYYKAYIPPEIELPFELTKSQAEFWNTVYRKGLGEFWYRNGLNPTSPGFRPTSPRLRRGDRLPSPQVGRRAGDEVKRVLLGIGGGKDSIVAAELLMKEGMEVTGFVVETEKGSEVMDKVVEALKIPVLKIRRTLDPKLFGNLPGSYNGHVPVSAMYAFLGTLLAQLHGFPWVAVGNEFSSDFGNLEYRGEDINHQWSKSSEFEQLFQDYVRQNLSEDIIYFSLLRPFHEIRIVKQLISLPIWNSIRDKFSSCNRNFVHHPSSLKLRRTSPQWPAGRSFSEGWCGECPKCAFVFAMLAAFLEKNEVAEIFGKNLYADANLVPMYQDLLGLGTLKPFDCVGTFEETQAAMWAAREKFTEDVVIKTLASKIPSGEAAWQSVMRFQAAPALPERFRLTGVERALILGYAREGRSSEQFLQKFYPGIEIGTADQKDGEAYLERQPQFDIAIKTPGIPKRFLTIPYTTATNMFFARVLNTVIGITGSKGKSTTASLIASMLREDGKPMALLGNIGEPMLEALTAGLDPEATVVLELSSQQLEDLRSSPQVAVITTLFPEHMDYHGSVATYYEAKKNIIQFQKPGDVFVYDPQHELLVAWAKQAPGRTVPFAEQLPVERSEIPLPGEHNLKNVRAAVAAAREFGVSDKAIAKAITTFQPLPHRLELVGEFRSIRFYDDAISTAPESTMAALTIVPRVGTLFLGGLDRGYDFTELAEAVRAAGVHHVVLFPESGAKIKPLLSIEITTFETESMEEAVKFAYAHTNPGEAVLLSTASPSYSLWANFIEQGNEFQKWARALA